MASKDASDQGLRKDIVVLHLVVVLLALFVIMCIYGFLVFVEEMPVTYMVGLSISVAGMAAVAVALASASHVGLAVGAALQFVGGGVAAIDILDLDNVLTLVLPMTLVPVAMGQYQIGATIMVIRNYTDAEGTDYFPAVRDLRDLVRDQMAILMGLVGVTIGLSLCVMMAVAFFRDVMALNSLAVMGVLLGTIISGASLLILLKGGKVAPDDEKMEKDKGEGKAEGAVREGAAQV